METVICTTIESIGREQWNNCLSGGARDNPFSSYEFLSLLETSGSIGQNTGWQPFYITFRDKKVIVGIIMSFIKSHSQGEYVFDHSWADAFQKYGGSYYPKLQIAVPFTPVTGERILVQKDNNHRIDEMIDTVKNIVKKNNISSLHITFCNKDFTRIAERNNLLTRQGIQYHWFNKNYSSFDDFLMTLTHRKRKNIRKEREQAINFGGEIKSFTGSQLTSSELTAFWQFYQNTGQRKWGFPYLKKDFFMNLDKELAEKTLLILAKKNGAYVAGALNFIGSDCLYGRYWGCSEFLPSMHFELCYYRAIDFAIERGLARVEAGAQGDHKIARGYEACLTYSSHWFSDNVFMDAVGKFLNEEKQIIKYNSEEIQFISPFKKGDDQHEKKI